VRTTRLTGMFGFVAVTLFGLTVIDRIVVKSQVQHYLVSYKPADIAMQMTAEPIAKDVTVTYFAAYSDTIYSIAEKYNTTWQRIYNKNVTMREPTDLKPGQEVLIPTPDELLDNRPIPSYPTAQTSRLDIDAGSGLANYATAKLSTVAGGWSQGNQYAAGNCTWYVKNKRPDLPNNLGNASTWLSRARAQGIETGSIPREGAVGQRGNHVVYVERINSDGTVTISEMNYRGLYKITQRTLPANYFAYIY
jgi:surface antigen